jgi:hypothetical protein
MNIVIKKKKDDSMASHYAKSIETPFFDIHKPHKTVIPLHAT